MITSMNSRDLFQGYSIVIAGDIAELKQSVVKEFSLRGSEPVIIGSGDDAIVDCITQNSVDVLLLITKQNAIPLAKRIAWKVTDSGNRPHVFWTISDIFIPLSDGFTPYEFKTNELLKPIYYSLLIYKDLLDHG